MCALQTKMCTVSHKNRSVFPVLLLNLYLNRRIAFLKYICIGLQKKGEAEDLMTRFQSCLDISVDEREGFLFANVPGPFEHRLYPTKVKTKFTWDLT